MMNAPNVTRLALLCSVAMITACSSIDADKMRAHIRHELPPHDTAPDVIRGQVLETIRTAEHGTELYVAYYDTTHQLCIAKGSFDKVLTQDTVLALLSSDRKHGSRSVRITTRSIRAVYRPENSPDVYMSDCTTNKGWIMIGVLAVSLGIGLIAGATLY